MWYSAVVVVSGGYSVIMVLEVVLFVVGMVL